MRASAKTLRASRTRERVLNILGVLMLLAVGFV